MFLYSLALSARKASCIAFWRPSLAIIRQRLDISPFIPLKWCGLYSQESTNYWKCANKLLCTINEPCLLLCPFGSWNCRTHAFQYLFSNTYSSVLRASTVLCVWTVLMIAHSCKYFTPSASNVIKPAKQLLMSQVFPRLNHLWLAKLTTLKLLQYFSVPFLFHSICIFSAMCFFAQQLRLLMYNSRTRDWTWYFLQQPDPFPPGMKL